MASFEKKEKNFVVIICNYSVCKVKAMNQKWFIAFCAVWVILTFKI